MISLSLYFEESSVLEVTEVAFSHPLLGETKRTVRGRSSAMYPCCGTFQWTSAVKAFAYLAILTAEHRAAHEVLTLMPRLTGKRGSLASSLDAALAKKPTWVLDMFGVDGSGRSLVPRIFARANPELKRPGPTAVCFNPRALPPKAISIFLNGDPVVTSDGIAHIRSILQDTFERESHIRSVRQYA